MAPRKKRPATLSVDVTSVLAIPAHLAPKPKRSSGPSGKSGVNQQPGKPLRAAPEQWERWKAAAARAEISWSEWARAALDDAARRR